jgi:hypothetical protein
VKNGRTIGEVIEELETDRDRLRALCEELGGALQVTVCEVSWFVSRRKDLGETLNEGELRTWADVLNEDLNIARTALKKAEQAPKP